MKIKKKVNTVNMEKGEVMGNNMNMGKGEEIWKIINVKIKVLLKNIKGL